MLCSPCDGIVGAHGRIDGTQVLQAKGMPYTIADLFGPTQDSTTFEGGTYVTLRLTSAMYHRFHAPHDATIEHVTHISGDTWNVNPIALARVERLFCRNERALLRLRLHHRGYSVALVPVAAILVASLRLHCLGERLHVRVRWDYPVHESIVREVMRANGMVEIAVDDEGYLVAQSDFTEPIGASYWEREKQ